MGSWSETCFVSNLPIHENHCRIVAIPVVHKESPGNSRALQSNYAIVGPPIRGVYDSYGGIDIDPDHADIVAPLRDAIVKNLVNVPYLEKDRYRDSLRGIGVSEENEKLHLGEKKSPKELRPDEPKDTIREWALCGDSSWLSFPDAVFPEDGDDSMSHYPVMWAFMLEEIYDHLMWQKPDEYGILTLELVNQAFDLIDEFGAREPVFKLSQNPFIRWAENVTRLTSFSHCGIGHYLVPGISRRVQKKLYKLTQLHYQLYAHRVTIHRPAGSQFGDYELHADMGDLISQIASRNLG